MIKPFLAPYRDWVLLLMRLVIGAIFIVHGMAKWPSFSNPAAEGTPALMHTLMQVLGVVEPVAGIAVLIGLLTPIAALILAIVMVGAMYVKMTMWGIGFVAEGGMGWEFDVLILASCAVLMSTGAGKISVDGMKRESSGMIS
jgi:putative oxidoreductase